MTNMHVHVSPYKSSIHHLVLLMRNQESVLVAAPVKPVSALGLVLLDLLIVWQLAGVSTDVVCLDCEDVCACVFV